MKIYKSGAFMGVKVIKNNTGLYATAYFKFKDGIFDVSVLDSITLKDIIDKYNIGVPNVGVKLSYTDYDKMIYFDCYIWDCEKNILNDMIAGLDSYTKKYISNLLNDIQPNCKVDNIGFCNDMNSLEIIDSAPSDFMKRESQFDTENWIPFDFYSLLTKHSQIMLSQNVVVSYCNSWKNEYWNGPQNQGGICQIGENLIESRYTDYDFSLEDIALQNRDTIWDENTIIDLEGNSNNGITILCRLKDIVLFTGIIDSEAINSAISTDIKILTNIKYTTHIEYLKNYPSCSIRLITVEKMTEHFENYKGMLISRYQAILQDTEILEGELCHK